MTEFMRKKVNTCKEVQQFFCDKRYNVPISTFKMDKKMSSL